MLCLAPTCAYLSLTSFSGKQTSGSLTRRGRARVNLQPRVVPRLTSVNLRMPSSASQLDTFEFKLRFKLEVAEDSPPPSVTSRRDPEVASPRQCSPRETERPQATPGPSAPCPTPIAYRPAGMSDDEESDSEDFCFHYHHCDCLPSTDEDDTNFVLDEWYEEHVTGIR